MNARGDKIETAIAHPVQGTSALSEVEQIDWSQQDPHTIVQKIRVLETILFSEADYVLTADEDTWLQQERIVLNIKCLCMGFHGMLHAVECLTRAEAA